MGEKLRPSVAGDPVRVCLFTTSLLIVKFFLLPHIKALAAHYDLTLIVNIDDRNFFEKLGLNVKVIHLPIKRDISPLADLKALILLFRILRKERFLLIHTVAPKAGLIGILAAWFARIPVRVHVFQGEVWANRRGLMRAILKACDRLVALFSTDLLVVSASERQFLIQHGILNESKSRVIANGSICGVNMDRFRPDAAIKARIRAELGIPVGSPLLLFVGRVNRDKGVPELLRVFGRVLSDMPDVHLLIVGPDEEKLLVGQTLSPQVRVLPYVWNPESYIAASDILLLPSHREGFGLVLIEAAAAGVPTVATRIYGIADAVQDGQTGLLFEPGDENDFFQKVWRLLVDSQLRQEMGAAGRTRCLEKFREETVISKTLDFYTEILGRFKNGTSSP